MKRIILVLCLVLAMAGSTFSQSERDLELLKQFPNKETVIYKIIEGDTLDMLLFLPKQAAKKKTPVVLYTHGGGWGGGDKYKIFNKPFFSALNQILDQGIACAAIEYRLTREGISTALDCVTDCKDAARFLMKKSEEFNLDTDRMGVWGGSAGGHLALMTGLASNDLFIGAPELENYDPLFKCIVSFYPMVTFIKPELNEGSNFSKPSRFIPILGGLLEDNMELAGNLSPVEHLHKSSPPILLVHGDQDSVLPVAQSRYFMEIAEKEKADVKYIEVQGAGHSFRGNDISPTMEEINDTTAKFIIEHLKEKPNIILFLIDDADKYQLGCYGGPVYTPNIDQLAEEGIMFHNAHVNSTVCTPSRYSLTTGRYPGRSLYDDYLQEYPIGSQGQPEFNVGLEHDFMNIGHLMQSVGYKTGWVGKFHLHTDNTFEGGLTSEEKDFLETANRDNPLATELFQQEEAAFRRYIKNKGFTWAKNIYAGNLEEPFKEHNLEWTIEAALDFIDSAASAPFYLHFNTTLLHGPDNSWERSMGYPEVTGAGIVDRELRANMPERNTVIERITSNGFNRDDNPAGITWLDDGVGAIMQKLESLGIADNTILVFLPDHGSANKASLFSKHGTNIPLIIRYPERIDAGLESNSLIQAIDLIPTFYEYAGVSVPENYVLDGTSLSPIFSNPGKKIHESIYMELGSARAVLTDRYKYIALRYTQDRIDEILAIPDNELKEKVIRKLIYLDGHVGISSRGIDYSPEYLSPDQLYDVVADPDEQQNLAYNTDLENKMDEMKTLLKEYLTTFPDRPFGEFIPGDNATPPNEIVTNYVRNIQCALRNGATQMKGILNCKDNCVLDCDNEIKTGLFPDKKKSSGIAISQNKDFIKIQSDKDIHKLKVFDSMGRQLKTFNGYGKELVLNKSQYKPGVYIITFLSDNSKGVYSRKIIVK